MKKMTTWMLAVLAVAIGIAPAYAAGTLTCRGRGAVPDESLVFTIPKNFAQGDGIVEVLRESPMLMTTPVKFEVRFRMIDLRLFDNGARSGVLIYDEETHGGRLMILMSMFPFQGDYKIVLETGEKYFGTMTCEE